MKKREVTEHSEIIDCDYYTAKHRPLPVNPKLCLHMTRRLSDERYFKALF